MQLKHIRQERDAAQAEQLITKQLLTDFKQQEADTIREYENEIDELKEKVDKTEFIIQYKEEIWTYLEREIRKVIHKDSDLLDKVQKKTRILTDCLASTKVSTVVKQNTSLVSDHDKACKKIKKLIENLRKELMASEMVGGNINRMWANNGGLDQSHLMYASLASIRSSLDIGNKGKQSSLDNVQLSDLVKQLT